MSRKSYAFGTLAAVMLAAMPVASGPAHAQMWMMDRGYGPGMMWRGNGPGAQGAGWGMMGGCGPAAWNGDGSATTFADGRIAFLKAELAITDAQMTAWNAYADALRKNFDSMKGMRQAMKATFDAKTPMERLDAHIAAMDARLKSLQQIKPTLAGLYSTLSDPQKKKADELMTGMGCMM